MAAIAMPCAACSGKFPIICWNKLNWIFVIDESDTGILYATDTASAPIAATDFVILKSSSTLFLVHQKF